MKLRTPGLVAVTLTSGLLLSACGSDDASDTAAEGEASAESAAPSASESGSGGGGGSIECFSGSLQTSGSSAQDNAMQEWIKTFQQECPDATINYQPVGSGAGIEAFLSGQTVFAGSDSALKEDEVQPATDRCEGGTPLNLPMVTGPIAVAYNLQGVDELVLDAATIAGIFQGEITSWDAQPIADLNPDAQLPSAPIRAIHRSDSSGTTDNFTKYLEAASGGAWTSGTGKEWSASGGEGAAKSSGVTQAVQGAQGAITYVEVSFAENAGLSTALIDTGGGEPVELNPETAGAAVSAAQVVGEGNDLALELDYATQEEGAYPIILVTYEITCETGLSQDDASAVKSFLSYTASDGQQVLSDQGYAPLPDDIASQVQSSVDAISGG